MTVPARKQTLRSRVTCCILTAVHRPWNDSFWLPDRVLLARCLPQRHLPMPNIARLSLGSGLSILPSFTGAPTSLSKSSPDRVKFQFAVRAQSNNMLMESLPALTKSWIVLASASPRRQELLQMLGLKPEVIPSKFEENLSKDLFPSAAEYAVATAKGKAMDVLQLLTSQGKAVDLIIGADTIVEHDQDILEKPADAQDATRMLSKLSGSKHFVHTGMVLVVPRPKSGSGGPIVNTTSVTTGVQFDELSSATISAYIETGHPFGKAGSYGIQGPAAVFVKHIDGDFFNVMGLPLNALANEISKLIEAGHLQLESKSS